ncbi:MAG TPA: Tex family protein [Spirochaetia bacterium]
MEFTEESVAALAVDEQAIIDRIATELSVRPAQASAVMSLTKEGGTVPFISRYRKEMTGSLDEVQVRETVQRFMAYTNLENRRLEIVRAIFSQGKLDEGLYDSIRRCTTMTELEDIYAPFKKKKKTRGMIAREKGLDPLAQLVRTATDAAVLAEAARFVRADAEHPELGVATVEEALQGAMDIVAEAVSQDPDNRVAVKTLYRGTGKLVVKGIGDEEKKTRSVYQMYWDYSEPLATLKPHRVLAINRGEREGELETRIEVDEETACALLREKIHVANRWHGEAIDDGLKRLLSAAVLREIASDNAASADGHGIGIFSENLKNLLMSPPLKGTRVLGMDPGIRTGTKCAAMDETGKVLGHFVINQERDAAGARAVVAGAVRKYAVQLIAVGNGTGSRDVRQVVADAIRESSLDVKVAVVDEDGASVYSASDVAREEFPDLDLTIRGAISIGRRLQDPLAELVKIDPKSIGVGLYQHDLDQKKLGEKLDEVVESVVNSVGVNVNTASASLLRHVSGINATLAKKIVQLREHAGAIPSREALRTVPGMGPKTFEQCAGFLKIPDSTDPLDNTWVHPESYALARDLLPSSKGDRLTKEARAAVKERYGVGDTTIDDILGELARPGRDPRDEYPAPILDQGILAFEDLKEGMTVKGKVKNVVDFGAFIDIGIKETGLVHVSEMGDGFVKDPLDALKVGDVKDFRVISLDPARKRIGLSLRSPGAPSRSSGARQGAGGAAGKGGPHGGGGRPRQEPRDTGKDDVYNPFAALLKKGR